MALYESSSFLPEFLATEDPKVSSGTDDYTDQGSFIRKEAVIVPILFVFITLGGFIGNIAVIFVNLRMKGFLRHTANVYITNLAIADLLFLIFCVPFHALIYTLPDWPFGNFMCKFVHLVQYSSMLASVFLIVAMSIDKFLIIAFPLKAQILRRPIYAEILSLVIWVSSLMMATPWLFTYEVKTYSFGADELRVCADDWGNGFKHRSTYFLLLGIISFGLPLGLIIIFSYFSLYKLRVPQTLNQRVQERSLKLKRRVTRILLVIVVTFTVCWAPTHILNIWLNYFPDTVTYTFTLYYGKIFTHLLSYANSAANPIIYVLLSSNFRDELRVSLSLSSTHGKTSTAVNRPQPLLYQDRKNIFSPTCRESKLIDCIQMNKELVCSIETCL